MRKKYRKAKNKMLSICIPIYNYDVTTLVKELHKQAESLLICYEILLIDDFSGSNIRQTNRKISSLSNVTYLELSENIGRSAIRNKLAEKSKYQYLIFMDCDVKITISDYIRRYAVCCGPQTVTCGGVNNPDKPLSSKHLLRWKYRNKREDINADERAKNPCAHFKTINFLIDKDIFESVKFDETIKGYGYEDTLFAIEIEGKGIPIYHIDNPVTHAEEDNCDDFICKVQEATRNLITITNRLDNPQLFIESVKILRVKQKITTLGLLPLFRLFYKLSEKMLLKNIKSKNPCLFWFDVYRLGYLCSLK